jgi:hypothetical protein
MDIADLTFRSFFLDSHHGVITPLMIALKNSIIFLRSGFLTTMVMVPIVLNNLVDMKMTGVFIKQNVRILKQMKFRR